MPTELDVPLPIPWPESSRPCRPRRFLSTAIGSDLLLCPRCSRRLTRLERKAAIRGRK